MTYDGVTHRGDATDRGLRLRMKEEEHRISSQHEKLDEFYTEVRMALDQGGVHTSAHAFGRFADALDAHMSVEDDIYFPALHGLRPDIADELTALVREHDVLRDKAAVIRALLEAGDRESSLGRLDELASLISDHESKEEALIARITSGPVSSLGRSRLEE